MQHEKNKKDLIRYITQTTERGTTDTHCTDNTEVTQTTDTEQTTDAKQTTYTNRQHALNRQQILIFGQQIHPIDNRYTDWTIDTLKRQQKHTINTPSVLQTYFGHND